MLEPPRSSAEAPYTSLGGCGSCTFAVLEPPRSSVVRVGLLCLNHPELEHKHPPHLSLAVMVWFV